MQTNHINSVQEAQNNQVFNLLRPFQFDNVTTSKRQNIVFRASYRVNSFFFDSLLCDNGFSKFRTEQDAFYFGVWVSNQHLSVLTYLDGEIWLIICPDEEHYKKEVNVLKSTYKAGDDSECFNTFSLNGLEPADQFNF